MAELEHILLTVIRLQRDEIGALKMELENLKQQVAEYEGLVQQVIDWLNKPRPTPIDPAIIQALADQLGAVNAKLQSAFAAVAQG